MSPFKTPFSQILHRGLLGGFLLVGLFLPQACGCNDTPPENQNGGSSNTDAGQPAADAGTPTPDAGPAVDAGPTGDDGGPAPDAGPIIPPVGGISITNADVRACDLLFQASQPEVPAINFNAAVRGRHVVGAPQVAASFVALQDQSLEGVEILEFVYERQPGAVTLVKADCFDSSGNAVASPGVSIDP
jgi:hypothetical protein